MEKEKEKRKEKRAVQRRKREDWQSKEDAAFAQRHPAWQRGELPRRLREERERREADNASHMRALRAARQAAFEEGYQRGGPVGEDAPGKPADVEGG